jgi:PEP-CTERM motif
VITDGKITARARCANRVEELPQQATSMSEPPAIKFDRPMQPLPGIAMTTPPVPFQSSLLTPPPGPGVGPAPPLSLYDPLGGGYGWIPLSPPPLPSVCGIGPKKPVHGTAAEAMAVSGKATKKKKINGCGSEGGMGEVPEPGTWLLVASGLAFCGWTARHKFVTIPIA